ncbi:GntR family transcriptional regulator [Carnimonas bestiolae]|uniref:GntR family transcriptional regulator n=1 Tax=Carnimonas bestiolae TaxID=3402172 RepID=UPI003EDB6ED6
MRDPAASLGNTTAATLRQWIVEGRLLPGQHLSEKQLAEQLEISRNTLREAFRLLTQQSLLTHIPYAGVMVARPDLAAIIDIYRVRRLIERQAVAEASPHHPAIERMEQAVGQARYARDAHDWLAVGSANIDFHRALVSLTDSPRIEAMYADLSAELRLAFGLVNDPARIHAPYIESNSDIVTLLRQGNNQQAVARLEAYLLKSERSLLAVYNG